MTIDAFRKALHHRPLSQQERDELTTDELLVLVLARRLDRLTDAEQQKLEPADRQYLASASLIYIEAAKTNAPASQICRVLSPGGKGGKLAGEKATGRRQP